MKEEDLGGEWREICFDKKTNKLNLELFKDEIGCVLLKLERCKHIKKGKIIEIKATELLRLHLEEAIELKAMIEKRILDFHQLQLEEYKYEQDLKEEKKEKVM